MKILLFITSINKTLDNSNKKDYIDLINNLEKIISTNNDDLAYISFCDNTENKNIILYHIRNIIDEINDKPIYLGKQFLGNVYYNDIKSGALLYKNGKLNMIEEIINYADEIRNNENNIELIIVDNEINEYEYKRELNKNSLGPFTLIKGTTSLSEVNENLESLYNIKKKELKLDN